jgi:hypothetical protein
MAKSRRVKWTRHIARKGRRGMHIGYWWESQKERDHWEDQDAGEWTIERDLGEIGLDSMDWIDVAQDRDRRRALVNTVMKVFHKMLRNS